MKNMLHVFIIEGLASSDKYLKLASQDREKSRKKTKHGKHKKKKKGHMEEESEEEEAAQHTVSTLVDMPEVSVHAVLKILSWVLHGKSCVCLRFFCFVCQGADTSDKEDDRSTADPYRRLDMDLDE